MPLHMKKRLKAQMDSVMEEQPPFDFDAVYPYYGR